MLLRALAKLAPSGMTVSLYEGVGELPHFNVDLDTDSPPSTVDAFRSLLRSADAVVISSPEYARGVPGSLKNALDWIVSSGELVDKPVILINASTTGGETAQAQLIGTLKMMTANVLEKASLTGAMVRKALDEHGNVVEPELRDRLRGCLEALRVGG